MWICASTLPICLAMRLMGQNFLPGWALDAGILDRATPFRLDALLLGGLLALWLRGPHLGALLCFARIGSDRNRRGTRLGCRHNWGAHLS